MLYVLLDSDGLTNPDILKFAKAALTICAHVHSTFPNFDLAKQVRIIMGSFDCSHHLIKSSHSLASCYH